MSTRDRTRIARRMAALAAAVLAAALLAFLVPQRRPPMPAVATTSSGGPVHAPAPAAHARPEGQHRGAMIPIDPAGQVERFSGWLERYRAYAVYPDWSRPAEGAELLKLDWNRLTPQDKPLVDKPAGGGRVMGELRLDRLFAGPGEPIRATLSVWRERDGKRQALDTTARALVQVREQGANAGQPFMEHWRTVAESAMVKGADGAIVASFTPSRLDALYGPGPLEARFVALVVPPDPRELKAQPFFVPFRHSRDIPLVVERPLGDRIEDGSLDVELDVDVRVGGRVQLTAGLYDKHGKEPIATFYRMKDLKPGRQRLTLTFFGRVLAEKGIDGPYQVKALSGYLVPPDGSRPIQHFEHRGPITTGSHRAHDFSRAEWDAPEKRARIAAYEQVIANFGGRGG